MNNINININININANNTNEVEAAQLRMLSWMMEEGVSLQEALELDRVVTLVEKDFYTLFLCIHEIQTHLNIPTEEAVKEFDKLTTYQPQDVKTKEQFKHMLELTRIVTGVYNNNNTIV